jgi:hypothetical protein
VSYVARFEFGGGKNCSIGLVAQSFVERLAFGSGLARTIDKTNSAKQR